MSSPVPTPVVRVASPLLIPGRLGALLPGFDTPTGRAHFTAWFRQVHADVDVVGLADDFVWGLYGTAYVDGYNQHASLSSKLCLQFSGGRIVVNCMAWALQQVDGWRPNTGMVATEVSSWSGRGSRG